MSELQFHLVSFEGPDAYCRAGGISTRVSGLATALADAGFETHFWFVGDPDAPGHEQRGALYLHRWCQWVSRFHPGGVYDGEDGKRDDFVGSLPPFVLEQMLRPHVNRGGRAIILAEEWHTADAVLHLDWLLRSAGLRERVSMLWNANNTFGFERVDWSRLAQAATITTVSRFMKHCMWQVGIDAVVIPNGLTAEAFIVPSHREVVTIRRSCAGRTLLAKIARWDPDKRWLLAMRIVRALKDAGAHPVLIARGGSERHGSEVIDEALRLRLRVAHRALAAPTADSIAGILDDAADADVINLTSALDTAATRCLLRAADVVLANSGREPFGLVGLETMAVGGLACTGCTGEDYAVPGKNAIVQQTNDPREFLGLFAQLRSDAQAAQALRESGAATARDYAWPVILQRNLLPRAVAMFGLLAIA